MKNDSTIAPKRILKRANNQALRTSSANGKNKIKWFKIESERKSSKFYGEKKKNVFP